MLEYYSLLAICMLAALIGAISIAVHGTRGHACIISSNVASYLAISASRLLPGQIRLLVKVMYTS